MIEVLQLTKRYGEVPAETSPANQDLPWLPPLTSGQPRWIHARQASRQPP
ncbi:hypothetical protein QFZ24_009265 [Streptomyces phaeochromogenes]|nr:hypothetical protein [Streptomyces phaeochromogenes]